MYSASQYIAVRFAMQSAAGADLHLMQAYDNLDSLPVINDCNSFAHEGVCISPMQSGGK